MKSNKESGSTLLYAIGAIIFLSAISASVSMMYSSSTQSELENNFCQKARYLAMSGLNCWNAQYSKYLLGQTYIYNLGNDKFSIKYKGIDSSAKFIVEAIGTVGQSKGVETNQRILANFVSPGYFGSVLKPDDNTLPTDEHGATTTVVTTVKDLSPYNNTGTTYGTAYGSGSTSPVKSVKGKIGNAFQFNCGQYARIVFPDINAYDIYYSGTIMLWFNAASFDHDIAGLVHKGESTNCCTSSDGKVCIYYDEVYTLQFWPVDSTNVCLLFSIIDGDQYTGRCNGRWNYIPIKSNTKFNNKNNSNIWYHIAITWIYNPTTNATKLIMYINGNKDSETDWTKPFKPRSNDADLVVGAQQNSNRGDIDTYFCGIIDELNVYNVPLSGDEVTSYYNAVVAGR